MMAGRSYDWSELPHLAKRTLWSVKAVPPSAADETWLLSLLSPAEAVLYRSMPVPDRAHAVDCALAVRDLASSVIVASALHDVGKSAAGLSTRGRVVVSLIGLIAPGLQQRLAGRKHGRLGQMARYIDHPEIGAAQLEQANASPLAVAWAREHHWPASQRTLDVETAARLAQADD